MEISPGIHRIACPFAERVVYCHLLVGAEHTLLVDTGMAFSPEQDIFPYMRRIGCDPETLDMVLITHSDGDHQGGNDAVRRVARRALFVAHRLDAEWIESSEALVAGRYSQFERRHAIGYSAAEKAAMLRDCQSHVPLDVHLSGGERYRLGPGRYVSFVHTPGHTWGHTAVLDENSRTLIAGEAALHKAILGLDGRPALPPTYGYIATYQATLERLLAMDLAVYAPAHWPVQRGKDIGAFVAQSLSYCRQTEELLLTLLQTSSQALTLRQIITVLNDRLGDWPKNMALELANGLAGHLNDLVGRGKLVEVEQDGLAAYRPAVIGE